MSAVDLSTALDELGVSIADRDELAGDDDRESYRCLCCRAPLIDVGRIVVRDLAGDAVALLCSRECEAQLFGGPSHDDHPTPAAGDGEPRPEPVQR
jgi:hypothetical protein